MATYSKTAREVEMPNGDVVVLHNAVTENSTSNIKKFKYDDNGHVTESTAANATDLNLNSYSTPTTGSTAIGTSDAVQTAIGKLDHQSQIDQTNILYNLNMGVKNLIRLVPGTFTNNVATFEITNDGKVIINSTSSGSSAITNNYITLPAGTYRQVGISVSGKGDVRLMNGSTRITDNPFTLSTETTLSIHVFSYATNSNVVITPMLCTEEAYAQSTAYQPPALPNYDLTRLEAEDRAALAEEIDAGAKNLIDCSLEKIKALNTSSDFVWNGNTVTAKGRTATINADKTITVAAGTGSSEFWLKVANYTFASGISYVLSGCPTNGSTTTYYMESDNLNLRDIGSGIVINTATTDGIYVVVKTTGSTPALTFKPMLCTLADWRVSQKHVPYCKPNSELTDDMSLVRPMNPYGQAMVSSGSLNNVTKTETRIYHSNVVGAPAGLVSGTTVLCETIIVDGNTGKQTLHCLCDQTNSIYNQTYPTFVRTKTSGTWKGWVCIDTDDHYRIGIGDTLVTSETLDITNVPNNSYLMRCSNSLSASDRKGISLYLIHLTTIGEGSSVTRAVFFYPICENAKSKITACTLSGNSLSVTYDTAGYHQVRLSRL